MTDSSTAAPASAPAKPAAAKPPVSPAARRQRILTFVRRVHMYLGLVLAPWVVFFGISGMLFNHPGVGESVRARPIPAAHFQEHTGLLPTAPDDVAREVIERLRAEGHDYRLDTEYRSRFQGAIGFATTGPGVKHLVLFAPAAGRGLLLTRPDRTPEAAPFAGTVDVTGLDVVAMEERLAPLLPTLGVEDAAAPLRADFAPVLRFRMVDAEGQRWNVTYDLGSRRIDGRPTDREPVLSLHDVLGNLHRTHHFPPELGPATFWALFADLTGLTLVLWALTGIAMWWQLKRTRMVGAVVASTGLLIAALVMVSMDGELRFGNVQPHDPGEEASPIERREPPSAEAAPPAPEASEPSGNEPSGNEPSVLEAEPAAAAGPASP